MIGTELYTSANIIINQEENIIGLQGPNVSPINEYPKTLEALSIVFIITISTGISLSILFILKTKTIFKNINENPYTEII